jgi:Glycolipid transfer protein (GLTP)
VPARADVSGNIERLAARAKALGGDSVLLFDIVGAEIADGSAAGSHSCTKGLLWLKRFLEFTLRLLQRLGEDADRELGEAARAAYDATLRPYHGYLTQALFAAVLYAAPYRATFESALLKLEGPGAGDGASPKALAEDMGHFASGFAPLLARIHAHLTDVDQDDPTRV